jgi:hypothetical protein
MLDQFFSFINFLLEIIASRSRGNYSLRDLKRDFKPKEPGKRFSQKTYEEEELEKKSKRDIKNKKM